MAQRCRLPGCPQNKPPPPPSTPRHGTSSHLFPADRKGSTQGDISGPLGRALRPAGGACASPHSQLSGRASCHRRTTEVLQQRLPPSLIPPFPEKEKKAPFLHFEFRLMSNSKVMPSPPSRALRLYSDKQHRVVGSEVSNLYKTEKAFSHALKIIWIFPHL